MGGRERLYALFFLGFGENVVGNVIRFTKQAKTTSISLHDRGNLGRIGRYILPRHGHRGGKLESV
jgi:hypothetical protein